MKTAIVLSLSLFFVMGCSSGPGPLSPIEVTPSITPTATNFPNTPTPTMTSSPIPTTTATVTIIPTDPPDTWIICWHGSKGRNGQGYELLIAYPVTLLKQKEGLRLDINLEAPWSKTLVQPWANDSLKICRVNGVFYGGETGDWFPTASNLRLSSEGLVEWCNDICKDEKNWEKLPQSSEPFKPYVEDMLAQNIDLFNLEPKGEFIKILGGVPTP